jgi:Rrf2 family protein
LTVKIGLLILDVKVRNSGSAAEGGALLSRTAEYALRAVVRLAAHGGQAQTAQQVAAATGVPAGYLAKILQRLARRGIVASQRGLRGGFTLARDPRSLSLLDVVTIVDPVRRITTCPLGGGGHGRDLCPLHRRLDLALAGVERVLAEARVSELLDHRGPDSSLDPGPPCSRAGDAPGP